MWSTQKIEKVQTDRRYSDSERAIFILHPGCLKIEYHYPLNKSLPGG